MNQPRKHSLLEAVSNTAVGFVLAVITQALINHYYNLGLSAAQNIIIVLIYTVVSILRGYILRRLFNYITIRKLERERGQRPFDPSRNIM